MASPPFDASPLWWPPAARLYDQLACAAVGGGGGGAAAQAELGAALRERAPWLSSGLSTFKPPASTSAAALGGTSLSLGAGKKIPIDPALVGDALELSAVAVRRWKSKRDGRVGMHAACARLPVPGLCMVVTSTAWTIAACKWGRGVKHGREWSTLWHFAFPHAIPARRSSRPPCSPHSHLFLCAPHTHHLQGIDEVQAYILVRRYDASTGRAATPDPAAPRPAAPMAALLGAYAQERAALVGAQALVLGWEEAGPGPDAGVSAVVRAAADDLLASGLLDSLAGAVCEAAAAPPGPPAPPSREAGTAAGLVGTRPPPPPALAAAAATEIVALLDVAILAVSRAGGGGAPGAAGAEEARWVRLAAALLAAAAEAPGGGGGALSAPPPPGGRRPDHLAAVLLIGSLGTGSLLARLAGAAAGSPVEVALPALAAPAPRRALSGALAPWATGGASSSTAAGVVAFGLAAFDALACVAGGEGGGGAVEQQTFLPPSAALAALATLASPGAGASVCSPSAPTGGACRAILADTLAAGAAAFDLGFATLAPTPAAALLDALDGVFGPDPGLCERVWGGGGEGEGGGDEGAPAAAAASDPAAEPIRRLIGSARAVFPALPTPLPRALAAMAAGPAGAGGAAAFLAALPTITTGHGPGDAAVRSLPRSAGPGTPLVAPGRLPLPGARWLAVPAGAGGRLLGRAPPGWGGAGWGPTPAEAWAAGGGPPPGRALVEWATPGLPPGAGSHLLLSRAWAALAALTGGDGHAATTPASPEDAALGAPGAPPPGAWPVLGPQAELSAALYLLARLAAPGGGGGAGAAALAGLAPPGAPAGGALALAAAASAALARRPDPPLDAIADALAYGHALARISPARVAGALTGGRVGGTASHLLAPAPGARAGGSGAGGLPALDALRSGPEVAAGRYPVTLAALRLGARLIATGVCGGEKGDEHQRTPASSFGEAALAHALDCVLPTVRSWPAVEPGERWRVAAAALRLVRRALGGPSAGLRARAAAALRVPGAVEASLLPALPPCLSSDGSSETDSYAGGVPSSEAAAEAEAAAEWLHLLPALIPQQATGGEAPSAATIAAALFRPGPRGGPPPATSLAALACRPAPDPAARAAGLRAVGALARAAGALPGCASLAGALPQGRPGTGLAPEVRATLVRPLEPAAVRADPGSAAAAGDVLAEVLAAHPALAAELLLPDNNPVADALAVPEQHQQPSSPTPRLSTLVASLRACVADAPRLGEDAPAGAAAALAAVAAVLTAGGRAAGDLASTPGFWEDLAVAAGLGGGQGGLSPPSAADAASTATLNAAAWGAAAQAAALECLAIGLLACPPPSSTGGGDAADSGSKALWATAGRWTGGGRADAVVGALQALAGAASAAPAPSATRLAFAADAAAAELLASVASDGASARSGGTGGGLGSLILAPGGLAAAVAAAAGPALTGAGFALDPDTGAPPPSAAAPLAAAAKALASAARGGPHPPAGGLAGALAAAHPGAPLLAAAAAPASPAWSPSTSAQAAASLPVYAWDVSALERGLGSDLAPRVPAVRGLCDALHGAAAAGAAAAGRSAALSSLAALVAVRAAAPPPPRGPPRPTWADAGRVAGVVRAALEAGVAAAGAANKNATSPNRRNLTSSTAPPPPRLDPVPLARSLLLLVDGAAAGDAAAGRRAGSQGSGGDWGSHGNGHPPALPSLPEEERPTPPSSVAGEDDASAVTEASLGLLTLWLRRPGGDGGAGAVTEALLAAALTCLRCGGGAAAAAAAAAAGAASTTRGPPASPAKRAVAARRALAALLAATASAAAAGPATAASHASAALPVVAAALRRALLPASEWLPALDAAGLDPVALITAAADQAAAVAASGGGSGPPAAAAARALTSALLLALDVARSPGGLASLASRGAGPQACALARWLLAPEGGGLPGGGGGAYAQLAEPATASATPPLTAAPPAFWEPAPSHGHWVSTLSLAAAAARGGEQQGGPSPAVAMLAAAQPRVVGALAALGGGRRAPASSTHHAQPNPPPPGGGPWFSTATPPPPSTTLASAREAAAAAGLLEAAAATGGGLGAWEASLPGSPAEARAAAARFLEAVARGGSAPPADLLSVVGLNSVAASLPVGLILAVTPAERLAGRRPARFPGGLGRGGGGGWFGAGVVDADGDDEGWRPPSSAPAGPPGGAAAAAPLLPPGVPSALAAVTAASLYAAAGRAAAFLAAAAPAVDEDEAAGAAAAAAAAAADYHAAPPSTSPLGPEWPDPSAVLALAGVAVGVAEALPPALPAAAAAAAAGSGPALGPAALAEAARAARAMRGLLRACVTLAASAGVPLSDGDAAAADAAAARLGEWVRADEV